MFEILSVHVVGGVVSLIRAIALRRVRYFLLLVEIWILHVSHLMT